MICLCCKNPMRRTKIEFVLRGSEIKEIEYYCNSCYKTAVRRSDGAVTWYDEKGNLLHPSHDRNFPLRERE